MNSSQEKSVALVHPATPKPGPIKLTWRATQGGGLKCDTPNGSVNFKNHTRYPLVCDRSLLN